MKIMITECHVIGNESCLRCSSCTIVFKRVTHPTKKMGNYKHIDNVKNKSKTVWKVTQREVISVTPFLQLL